MRSKSGYEIMKFDIRAVDGVARRGTLTLPRGVVNTPAFMPVGTGGTVKAMTPDSLAATGSDIILANTYHLMLRPGAEIVRSLGGLGKMMGWPGPILTDSGGFQIMSLSKLTKIDRKIGAIFKSHIDGKKIILSPEKSIQVKKEIDSDILMVLDECPKLTMDKKLISKAIDISTDWAKRSKIQFVEEKNKSLLVIVQGEFFQDLRAFS